MTINSSLVPISKHCDTLYKCIYGTIAKKPPRSDDYQAWANAAYWLHTASSVIYVQANVTQHDPSFGYCSAPDEYNLSREKLLESSITELTIFNFVWGALEILIDVIKPPKNPDKSKRGKIRDTCSYLQARFDKKPILIGYLDELAHFRNIANNFLEKNKVEHRFKQGAEFGVAGVGLFAVYALRNSFAHGSMKLPEPNEDNQPISKHAETIHIATRILLLSIQMLLLAHHGESKTDIHMYEWLEDIDCDNTYPLWVILRGCHLAKGWPINLHDDDPQLYMYPDFRGYNHYRDQFSLSKNRNMCRQRSMTTYPPNFSLPF